MFSVDTEDEAQRLIVIACPRDDAGHHYARELVHEQSLENLQAFSDRLASGYKFMKDADARHQAEKAALEENQAFTPPVVLPAKGRARRSRAQR